MLIMLEFHVKQLVYYHKKGVALEILRTARPGKSENPSSTLATKEPGPVEKSR